jgi:hypothetical protein
MLVGEGVPAPAVSGQSMDHQDLHGAGRAESVQVEFVGHGPHAASPEVPAADLMLLFLSDPRGVMPA